jgi:hypothetical protein
MRSRPLWVPSDGLEPSRPTSWASLPRVAAIPYATSARGAGCEFFRIDLRLARLALHCVPSIARSYEILRDMTGKDSRRLVSSYG